MKVIQYGNTGSDETATYNVFDYPKKVTDFIQEVLKRINEWGTISIKGYGTIEYRHGELLKDIPGIWNLKINNVTASGGWSYMNYDITVDFEERYNKLKAIASKMYHAAQYLSDNPNSAESLREAMKEYYNFINDIK